MNVNFFDSNIFVYLFDDTDERKRNIADELISTGARDRSAAISFQVVQETLNVLSRKISTPMTPDDTKLFLQNVLEPLWKVYPNAALYRHAIDVQQRYGFSFYDSLIVASALDAGCKKLYTEDMQHGQRIGDLTIENPFR